MMVAIEHGNAPMCHYLIDHAADVFLVDKMGQSTLMKAAEHGMPDVYHRILRTCPDVDQPDWTSTENANRTRGISTQKSSGSVRNGF